MVRRFVPHLVIACLVSTSVGVSLAQKVTSDPCAELLSSFYSAPFYPTVPHALNLKMGSCNFMIQFYDAEQAFVSRVAPGGICNGDSLGQLSASHGVTLLHRIEACHAAAVDPDFKASVETLTSEFAMPQTPFSETQRCSEELWASLTQDVPPDRAFKAFESHRTKKHHCDFLLEVSNSEQAIIDRFESASPNCGVLDRFKAQHTETLETQAKVCEAAAVDPDGLLTYP
jgi:hypothetical protein